jgi:hypothetical protein
MEELQLGRVSIYTPDAKCISQETFKKPFVLVGEVPCGSQFLDVRSLPNVLDVMGMPSGGGPPGFSVLNPKMGDEHIKFPARLVLIAGFLPGADIVVKSKALNLAGHIGTCTTVGLVVNYFEFILAEGYDGPNPEDAEEVARFIEENGYVPIQLVEYETPEILLRGMAAVAPGAPGG